MVLNLFYHYHNNFHGINPAGKCWSPGRPRPLKILFDRPDLTSRGRPNQTSWGHPEMTSRGRLNLMFKGRPLEDLESTQTWMSKLFLNFLSELIIRLTKSKSISTMKLY